MTQPVSQLMISRRDVDFLLFEWLHVQSLLAYPRFAAHDTLSYQSVLDVAELLARDLFRPHNKINDSDEPKFDGESVIVNPEVGKALRGFAAAGLISAGFPAEFGGLDLPAVVSGAAMAFMSAANIATSAYAVLTIANANLLIRYGTATQVERYIPRIAQGQFFGTMCLSEAQAGSSLADIRARAERQPDGRYRLFGQKMWISGGEHEISENIVHLVLAKIPDANGKLPLGVKGISLFLTPRKLLAADGTLRERNDIALAGIIHKMGYRGTVNCLLNFGEGKFKPEGAPGAIAEIIGDPGQGLTYMFHMMNEARISVGLGAAALAYTGYLHALDYARNRSQGRPRSQRNFAEPQVPIIRHPDVKRMLLAQKAYAEGALALCLYVARVSDDGRSAPDPVKREEAKMLLDLLTPIAKSWPSEWGLVANDLAIQVHGGYGYTREYDVEQFYRDNRLNPIHEGTTGVQALDLLDRKTRAHDGAAMDLLSQRIAETVRASEAVADLAASARTLGEAWLRLFTITRELHAIGNAELRTANAVAYLQAFGHIVVGWLWLDQAVVARAALAEAIATTPNFYLGKLSACRFYFAWEMPKVAAWFKVLGPVERTPLDMADVWF